MSFRGRVFTASLSYPSDAGLFMAKSVSGGAYTTTQKRALGYLVSGLADLGIGAPGSNWLIYPFIGGTAAKHALNLYYPGTAEYNLTFVGSPTQDATGTLFNGTTQYATGVSLAINPLSPSLTTANISYGFCTSGIGAGTYIPIGFFSSAAAQTKTYSTSGTFTFNPNVEAPGVTAFTITAVGGGGAGGGTASATGAQPGGGGAGGNYVSRAVTLTKAQGATNMTIVVGGGGFGVTASMGGSGNQSSVTHPNFTGIAAGGGGGGGVNTSGTGGAAGTVSGTLSGSSSFAGGAGRAGSNSGGFGGSGGGSSAGTGIAGNAGSVAGSSTGGAGGTAPTGGVAGGAGGSVSGGIGTAGSPGTAGGGAGGGAGGTTGGNNRAGGSGGAGKVTISWSPGVFKRNTLSIFSSGDNQIDCSVDTDATSKYQYTSTPSLNGVRVGSRRGNTGASTDIGFYVNNNAGTSVITATMSTTSYDPSPIWYIGAANSNNGGTGSLPVSYYSGYLNFVFMGPAMTNGQLQAMYTLITTYNTILGR
jgi:hypothetical protein